MDKVTKSTRKPIQSSISTSSPSAGNKGVSAPPASKGGNVTKARG